MRTAFAMVLLLLLAGLVQPPQTTELADEITVFATDEYTPYANITMGSNQAIAANIAHSGTKNVAGQDWDVYRFTLDSTGQLNVQFDGSNSYDPDATSGNGIDTYEWNILFDAPYGDTSFNLEGHTFSEPASSNGLFSYSFQNVTVSEDGTQEHQIRMELRVYDAAGKMSEKFRMYFVVADSGSVDQEPVFQIDASDNMTSTDSDVFHINGTLVSGSESGDVYVEGAFSMDDFDESAIVRYNLMVEGLYDRSEALSDSDTFSLQLSLDGMYTNLSETVHIYIRTYEGDNQRWVTYHWFEITLLACQGLVAPQGAIDAGGEFILDSDGECQWEGAWTYDSQTGQWEAPEPVEPIDVKHNSTLSITEVGPFKSSVDTYSIDGVSYPVLYLKESFHIDAIMTGWDGNPIANKCLNIYVDPQENNIPITTVNTSENGTIEWFSGDRLQNPSLRGIETTGGKLEGLRTIRVAYEPNGGIADACNAEPSGDLQSTAIDIDVLVKSRTELRIWSQWTPQGSYYSIPYHSPGADSFLGVTQFAHYSRPAMLIEGEHISGDTLLKSPYRIYEFAPLPVENEIVYFVREYWSENDSEWIVAGQNESFTNSMGVASFNWSTEFIVDNCQHEYSENTNALGYGVCTNLWRITAHFPGSTLFAESTNKHSQLYEVKQFIDSDGDGTNEDDEDDEGEDLLPGFEAWLLILALLFAVSFRRKLNV